MKWHPDTAQLFKKGFKWMFKAEKLPELIDLASLYFLPMLLLAQTKFTLLHFSDSKSQSFFKKVKNN